jgi:adenylate cyclase
MLRTIGFVDLVEFTALAGSLSVGELAAVLMEFDSWTSDVISQSRGQVVKTIGDEVMFVTEQASDACKIAMELARGHDGLPSLRIGLAAGEVLSLFGDLYGPDVNLASRLVSAAEPAQAFVSERVRRDAGPETGAVFESVGLVTLKGFKEPLPAYRLVSI